MADASAMSPLCTAQNSLARQSIEHSKEAVPLAAHCGSAPGERLKVEDVAGGREVVPRYGQRRRRRATRQACAGQRAAI